MQRKLQNEGRMEVHVLYKEFTDSIRDGMILGNIIEVCKHIDICR